jgi:hypothetical protein
VEPHDSPLHYVDTFPAELQGLGPAATTAAAAAAAAASTRARRPPDGNPVEPHDPPLHHVDSYPMSLHGAATPYADMTPAGLVVRKLPLSTEEFHDSVRAGEFFRTGSAEFAPPNGAATEPLRRGPPGEPTASAAPSTRPGRISAAGKQRVEGTTRRSHP